MKVVRIVARTDCQSRLQDLGHKSLRHNLMQATELADTGLWKVNLNYLPTQ